jgi:hypothetical protein
MTGDGPATCSNGGRRRSTAAYISEVLGSKQIVLGALESHQGLDGVLGEVEGGR